MKYKLVCFDLDGTLVDEITHIWDRIHKAFGIDRGRVAGAMRKFHNGEISFGEWAEHDIRLWVEKGKKRKDLLDVVKKLELMPGAMETLNELKKRGYRLAVVSGGLNVVLDHFIPDSAKIFDHTMINRLYFDGNGNISRIVPVEFETDKLEALKAIAGREGISLDDCVFVGDSEYDIEIAKGAGLGIGFNPHDELAKVCDVVIKKKDLREILRHIE